MIKQLKKLMRANKRHKFVRMGDANVHVSPVLGYFIPCFQCSECGCTLHLEPWQMNDLPRSMKRGCPPVVRIESAVSKVLRGKGMSKKEKTKRGSALTSKG